MQHFKAEIYETTTGKSFPNYKTLPWSESEAILDQLHSHLGFEGAMDDPYLLKQVGQARTQVRAFHAKSPDFSLESLFNHLGVSPQKKVFLWWDETTGKEIDVINAQDVCRDFKFIWYPASDDLDIFDDSFSWLITIDHEGNIEFLHT